MMNTVVILSLSLVVSYARTGFGPGKQDWNYVTVRPNSYMFWWLHETTATVTNATEKPLLIWLQGGPGSSSTGFGNFAEIGPLDVDLNYRNKTWLNEVNVLFIDNPVGSGYSYVEDPKDLATTNKQIADDLITCIFAFYKRHPNFRNVPLYVAGESYGGKMALEFAIQANQLSGNETINFKGLYLLNSWISAIDLVVTWAPYLYNMGAIDYDGFFQIEKSANDTKKALDNGEFEKATELFESTELIVKKVAKNVNFYNILTKVTTTKDKSMPKSNGCVSEADMTKLDKLMNGPVKEVLKVNVTHGAQSSAVNQALNGEFMKPVTHLVERLLNETTIKVVVVTSQLDVYADTPGTIKWVDNLRWKNVENWKKAPRDAFVVDGFNEGYQKIYGTFSLYWVNRAGHRIPLDNLDATVGILSGLIGVKRT